MPISKIVQDSINGGVSGSGPAFNATTNSTTTVGSSTWTKVTLNTELFDTNSNFDTSNSRFTPTVAGYYQINGYVEYNAATTAFNAFSALYKNGSFLQYGAHAGFNSSNGIALNVATVVYCNGSSDYIELYTTQNTGSNQTVGTSVFMSGFLARAA